MITLKPDLSERKRILKNICRTHKQWKIRMVIFTILVVITFGICGAVTYLLFRYHIEGEGILLVIGVGIIFACIPFFISLSVKNTAKYKCAFPYSSYANASLILTDERLQYVFWRVGPHEPAAYSSKRAVYNDEDKFVYEIETSDIESCSLKGDIFLIKGKGKLHMPKWAGAFLYYEDDLEDLKKCKEFSFILAFEEEDKSDMIIHWMIEHYLL